MVVDKRLTGDPAAIEEELTLDPGENIIDVPSDDEVMPEDVSIVEDDEGGVVVDFNPSQMQGDDSDDFFANLAETVDSSELTKLGNDLIGFYREDKQGRKDWEMAYVEGLDLLGFKYEEREQPFRGASGISHPLLAESVVQFQAQAYKELLPPDGPVRTQIVGVISPETEKQAQRVKEYMNYQITDVMEEYDPDMDQLLFYLPLAGSAFKKVYYDESMKRAVSKFVACEDLVVPYITTDLRSAERITHVVHMQTNDLRKMQVSGFYRDIPIYPEAMSPTDSQSKINELQGERPGGHDEEYILLECHVDLDLLGYEDTDEEGEPTGVRLPYIVTADESSGEVLAIRRNWSPDDEFIKKKQYFVHFKFLPGLGFYGFGLIHMIGGLSRSATSILRQLIDAGTLANLPAGFKARGIRIRDDDEPLSPGEFRDVDSPGGNLRDSLLPLPYKEPSATLFQLLGLIIQSGQRFSAISELPISENGLNREMPVGTTMALLERGTKVMSGIHKRLHHAQRLELKLLAAVFADYLPPEYPYDTIGAEKSIKASDFDKRVDIIPVSDPNIFSSSQRAMLAQMQLQLAQAAPDMHNMYEAYRRMYEALGIKDVDLVLPPPKDPQPTDAAEENRNVLSSLPLQAFMEQNHQAHIVTHMAMMKVPVVMAAPLVTGSLTGHVAQHISMQARKMVTEELGPQIQQAQAQGIELNEQQQQQLMADAENRISELIAQLTTEVTSTVEEDEDPLVELRRQELRIKEADLYRKAQDDVERLKLDKQENVDRNKIAREKIDSQEDIAEMRGEIAVAKMDSQEDMAEMRGQLDVAKIKQGRARAN
jgi:hypothetical protein